MLIKYFISSASPDSKTRDLSIISLFIVSVHHCIICRVRLFSFFVRRRHPTTSLPISAVITSFDSISFSIFSFIPVRQTVPNLTHTTPHLSGDSKLCAQHKFANELRSFSPHLSHTCIIPVLTCEKKRKDASVSPAMSFLSMYQYSVFKPHNNWCFF